MLIVLPPSETKAAGGTQPPLDIAGLHFPTLNPIREALVDELSALSVDKAMNILKLGPKLRGEAVANTQLRTAPTTPALARYTGVLFDALDAATLPPSAWERLAVGSALFGVVMATDAIPKYRLSASSKLGGTMKSRWGNTISQVLDAEEQLIVDMRSGAYQQLGPCAKAITVRVETTNGKVVSHFNKHYKGELARVLAMASEEPATIDDVVAAAADMKITVTSPTSLTLIVDPT